MACNCNNYRSMSGLGARVISYSANDPRFAQLNTNNVAQDYTQTAAYQALNADKNLQQINRQLVVKQDKAEDNTAMYLGVGAAAALALLLLI